jgi:hypothetical protein
VTVPPTLYELLGALTLVAVGIVIGDVLAERRRRRGLPFHPRCR